MTLHATMARGVVRATGSEAAAYLQGQISQDVDAIAPGSSAWSLVLDPAGKLVAWFRVHCIGSEEFVLDCAPGAVAALVARLERFKLRTDVVFAVEDGWQIVRTHDGAAPAGALTGGLDWPGFALADALSQVSDIVTAVDDGFEEARIRAALPEMGVDIHDDTIPAEGGDALIELSVSFTKGCYTGQELVARIDSRGGNVPRPLRVLVAAAPLAVGAPVVRDGQEIGTISSAAASVGLGRILRKAEIGSTVDVGGVAAVVTAPTGQS